MTPRIAFLALVALAAATPGLAQAQARTLALLPADIDRDGRVSQAEAEAWIGRPSQVREVPLVRPAPQRVSTPEPPRPFPLSMERRLVPASDFELLVERRFEEAVQDDHKKKRY